MKAHASYLGIDTGKKDLHLGDTARCLQRFDNTAAGRRSGRWKGKRRIYGGRAPVRKALYMAAKSAAQHCPVLSVFYQRLRAAGKPYNVALIACARKILIHLNTLMANFNTPKKQNLAPEGA